MKERPILFSGEMVKALLDGRKTQTRRVIKPQPEHITGVGRFADIDFYGWQKSKSEFYDSIHTNFADYCPYGQPGDQLWVRENCAIGFTDEAELACDYFADGERRWFERTIYNDSDRAWLTYINDGRRPSIHMPRWASRITLEITGIRVERLQEISDDDAEREGFIYYGETLAEPIPTDKFQDYWDKLNAKRGYSWESNPWVWCITFRRM